MSAKSVQFKKAFDLFPASWALVKKNMSLVAPVILAPTIVIVAGQLLDKSPKVVAKPNEFNLEAITGMTSETIAVLIVVSVVAQAMLTGLSVAAVKGQKMNFSDLWEVARKYTFRLMGLGIVFAAAIIGGLILLIVPGLIVLQRYMMAPYIMVDKDLGIMESLKHSNEISKPYPKPIWSLIGVLVLISLVGGQPFGLPGMVLSICLSVAYAFAPALRYQELVKA